MLLSMTGFGDSRVQSERFHVAVEVRTVNNRYLKISTKCPDAYAAFDGEIEKLVRGAVSRGTVSVAVRIERIGVESRFSLDNEVLHNYWQQLQTFAESVNVASPTDLGNLLDLPGVVSENLGVVDNESVWPLVRDGVSESLAKLADFRIADGRLMQQELVANCEVVGAQLEQIAALGPEVVRQHRDRLHERVSGLLAETDARVDPTDLIREVSIFAERCDIAEEITRLRSHLEQFAAFVGDEKSLGRKLEFLSQEMFREVNTIGAKANNVEIAHCVVEMKGSVEKIREILQNVE